MNRVVLYRRISGAKRQREGASLETQREEMRRYAESNGWVIVDEVEDSLSGLIQTRPGYVKLVQLAKQKMMNHVLIWRLDRLNREDADGIAFCNSLDRLGIELHSATQGPLVDPMLRGMLLVWAKQESRNTSARVVPNLRRAVSKGKHVSRPPFGYRPGLHGCPVVYEPEAQVIRDMFRMVASGEWTAYGLVTWLNNLHYEDGTPVLPPGARNGQGTSGSWNINSIKYILKNKMYYGQVEYDRRSHSTLRKTKDLPITHTGTYEPLITKETYDKVQEQLANRTSRRTSTLNKERAFLFTGLVRCGICGRSCTGSWNNYTRLLREGKDPHQWPEYKCDIRSHGSYSGRKLEKMVMNSLSDLLALTPEALSGLRQRILSEQKQIDPQEDYLYQLQSKRVKLLKRISNADIDLADRLLSRERHQDLVLKTQKEIAALDQDIEGIEQPADPTAFIHEAEEFLLLLGTIRNLKAHLVITNKSFEDIMSQVTEDDIKKNYGLIFAPKELEVGDFLEMSVESKYRIISKIVDHVIIERGKEPRIVWRDWAQKILERIA